MLGTFSGFSADDLRVLVVLTLDVFDFSELLSTLSSVSRLGCLREGGGGEGGGDDE